MIFKPDSLHVQSSLVQTLLQIQNSCFTHLLLCIFVLKSFSSVWVRFLSGLVPEPQGQVEEEGAVRPDPTGQESLRSHVRFIGVTEERQLHTGEFYRNTYDLRLVQGQSDTVAAGGSVFDPAPASRTFGLETIKNQKQTNKLTKIIFVLIIITTRLF